MVIVMASAFIIVPASTMLMNPNVLGLNFITLRFYQANTEDDTPILSDTPQVLSLLGLPRCLASRLNLS